jgi:hypothetical protein
MKRFALLAVGGKPSALAGTSSRARGRFGLRALQQADRRSHMRSAEYVDREEFICAYAAGKRVLDWGVVGPTCLDGPTRGRHQKVHAWRVHQSPPRRSVSTTPPLSWTKSSGAIYRLISVSLSVENVADELADERPFELVILGDILEQLSNPGRALDSVRRMLHPPERFSSLARTPLVSRTICAFLPAGIGRVRIT